MRELLRQYWEVKNHEDSRNLRTFTQSEIAKRFPAVYDLITQDRTRVEEGSLIEFHFGALSVSEAVMHTYWNEKLDLPDVEMVCYVYNKHPETGSLNSETPFAWFHLKPQEMDTPAGREITELIKGVIDGVKSKN